MPFPQKLCAVVSHAGSPAPRKENLVDMQRQKLREIETKQAVDRANTDWNNASRITRRKSNSFTNST